MWVMRNTGDRISKARVDGKDSTEATRLKTPFRRETIEEAGTVRLDRDEEECEQLGLPGGED